MSKGTASFGKKNSRTHKLCRRCGKKSFHISKYRCSSCAFPDKKIRKFNWAKKAHAKRSTGTGRRRHLKKFFPKPKITLSNKFN